MISQFLTYLETQAIPYIIPNGYKDILEGTVSKGGDVDILMPSQVFKSLHTIVQQFCDTTHYKQVQCYHQDVYAKNIFLYHTQTQTFLNLDFYGKLLGKDVQFFDDSLLFPSQHSFEGLPILAPHQELVYYLVKRIDKQALSSVHFEHLRQLIHQESALSLEALNTLFKTQGTSIYNLLVNDDFSSLKIQLPRLKTDIRRNRKKRIGDRVKDSLRIAQRIMTPTGSTIAFLGPDGSGKSTIIEGVRDGVLPFRRVDYFHLKPLPTRHGLQGQTVSDPHALPPYAAWKSYLKLGVFFLQYNYGWLKYIMALKTRSSLIIFDRYYDDLLVDHKRYRYGGSSKLARLFRAVIPKPDLYLILVTDPEIIHQRKQEVTLEELERQIEQYKALADDKRYCVLDVRQTPEQLVNQAIDKLMHQRYGNY